MLFRFLTLFLLSVCFSIEAKSISQYGQYVEYCQRASRDEEDFKNFKRHPFYRCILEHATYQQGQQYLEAIYWHYPHLLSRMDKFRQNDSIGHPVVYSYPLIGKFSPTTLQYIKIAGDLYQHFGDLSQLRIIEIGGGYGGQCFILSQLTGFRHYTIVDLPECLLLAEKYLKTIHVPHVSFMSPPQLDNIPQADLLISNYAFSEIQYDEQMNYLEKLIKRIPMGYMTINFISKLFGISSLSEKDLVQALESYGASVMVLPEDPPTGDHNIIIMWKPPLI